MIISGRQKRCTIDFTSAGTYIFRGFVEFNEHFLYRESCHDSNNIGQKSLLVTQGQHLGIAGGNRKTGHGSSYGGDTTDYVGGLPSASP